MKPLTHEWVKKAENDFKVASQILRRRKDRVPDAACFFCQQCLEKYLKAPIVFLGLSLPEHGYHAPNENFDWEQASGGMRMFALYFEMLARLPARASRR